VVVDKESQRVICTSFANGKRHDFRLFKDSKVRIHVSIKALTDSGYQGIKKLHSNSELPKKRSKKCPLAKARISFVIGSRKPSKFPTKY